MLKDFYYDPNNFTLPLPSGDYQFILSWLVDRKPLIIITVHISYFQDIFGFWIQLLFNSNYAADKVEKCLLVLAKW